MNKNLTTLALVIAISAMAAGCTTVADTSSASAGNAVTGSGILTLDAQREMDRGYDATLTRLYSSTPGSRELVGKAHGVLVFPRVIAAGLILGGQYGQGKMMVNGGVSAGYYRTTSGSVGLQAGAESRSLVFLFMTEEALTKFQASHGWAAGVDATVALLKAGANGAIDINSARAPTMAFVLTGNGLMAGVSLEGTKLTKIEKTEVAVR